MSAILHPPFRKMVIRCQIRNQRPQEPWGKNSTNHWVSKISCPPYCVRHFEFRKSDVKFIISNLKSFWVQNFAEIVWFPKLHVRHIRYPPFCEGYGYLRSVRQFFPCSSNIPITVRIESQYSFAPKNNYEKKLFPIFWYFSPNLAPYWISYWTKLNFDHGFLKSKTIRKHDFRLEISHFQS